VIKRTHISQLFSMYQPVKLRLFVWANKSNICKLTAIKLQVINNWFKLNAFCNKIDNKEVGFLTKLREE